MYGPKGEGALFLRKKIDIVPFIVGGGHERGLRSGTLNVPGIVGLAKACAICHAEMTEESARLAGLRDRLLAGLRARVPNIVVNGSMEYRLPNNLHVSFPGVDGESLMISIGDIAVSAGSACAAGSATPSHVMHALLGDDDVPAATVRFGLTRLTTAEEIDYAVDKFAAAANHLRH
jgi:cysteine desulfurase